MVVPKTKWKKHKVKHWFLSDTIDLIRHKRKLYKAMKHNPSDIHVRQEYRHVSNLVRSKTRHDTKEKAAAMSQSQSSNPKLFWRWANSVKRHRDTLSPLRGTSLMILVKLIFSIIIANLFLLLKISLV